MYELWVTPASKLATAHSFSFSYLITADTCWLRTETAASGGSDKAMAVLNILMTPYPKPMDPNPKIKKALGPIQDPAAFHRKDPDLLVW